MNTQSPSRLRSCFRIYPDDATVVVNALGQIHVITPKAPSKAKADAWKNDPTAQLPDADPGKVWKWYEGRVKADGTKGKGFWRMINAPKPKNVKTVKERPAPKDGYEWREIVCTRKDGTTYTQTRQCKIRTEAAPKSKGYTKAQLREMFGYVRPSSRMRRPDDDLMVAMGYLRAA